MVAVAPAAGAAKRKRDADKEKPTEVLEAFESALYNFKGQVAALDGSKASDDDYMAEALDAFGDLPTAFAFHSLKGKCDTNEDMQNRTTEIFDQLKLAGFNFRVKKSPMSGRWQRAILSDAALRNKYTDANGDNNLQASIRRDWGEGEYNKYTATKTHTQTRTKAEHDDRSCYMTPKRIAWKEGGGKSRWKNAVNICLLAQQVGGQMIWYDDRAKGWKYLYNVKGYRNELAEAFTVHKEWVNTIRNDEEEEDGDAGEGQPTMGT